MDKKTIRDNIAIELLTSGFLQKESRKLIPNDEVSQNDLVCETIMIILEYKPVGAIYKVYVQGTIKPFIKKIMLYQIINKSSKFYKNYLLHQHQELTINEEIIGNNDEEQNF